MQFSRRSLFTSPDGGTDASPRLDRMPHQRIPILTQYLSILRRRKWLISGVIAGAILVGLVVTLMMTPQYTAQATLEIQRETRNFTNVEGVQPETSPLDLEFYETQYGLLQAKSLADRVAGDMQLFDNHQFFAMFDSDVAAEWFDNGRVRPGASTREQRTLAAGAILLEHLNVSPVRLSRLVNIGFTSPNPEFSKRVVDAWGVRFVQVTLERRFEATSHARRFLEQRLAQLRARLDVSERNLVGYAAREGIVNLPTTTVTGQSAVRGERSLVADNLASINQELAQATADRVRAQSRLGESGGSAREALENEAISQMRQRRAELSAEYARMMVQFEPTYPPAEALRTQIEHLDNSIGREERRVRTNLEQTYRAGVVREGALEARVDQLKAGMLDLRRRSIQYNIFQRDVDTNQQLYDALLQRYKEIGIAGGVGVNNISIVNQAELPIRPSSPRLLLNLLLAVLAGTALGVAAALVMEQVFEGISDPAELEDALDLPLIGTVPKFVEQEPIEALEDRKSSLAEAYLSVQTSLSFSTDHGVPRSLAVTSTRPAEGKSITSYAIALSLARANRRTVLVDADLRSPTIHHTVNVSNESGLSNYLAGDDDLNTLVKPTVQSGLFVLTAGPQPPSAAELLSGDRLEHLIAELTKHYDHVIFDAPPVMGLADAPLIASRVEGTVFVVESHATKTSLARMAIDRLRAANVQLVGGVLTKFDFKRAHYGYGYDYGYGYGSAARQSA